jgi:hypothetical protein
VVVVVVVDYLGEGNVTTLRKMNFFTSKSDQRQTAKMVVVETDHLTVRTTEKAIVECCWI